MTPRRHACFAGIIAIGLALLVACDADRSAGNNGTSTDNVVTARLYSVDSIAARLERPDTGAYPLLITLDSSGIDFSKALADGGDLLIQTEDSTPLPFQIREWSPLEQSASLWVRIPRADLWWNKYIRILHGGENRWNASDSTAAWTGVSDSMRRKVTSLLLADFEQDSLFALLPCECNRWYMGWSVGTVILRPALGGRIESAVGYDSIRKSDVLHFAWASPATGWMLFGTRLGTTIHRMAALDSIVFWAKGNGTIRIALEDRRDSSDVEKAWALVQLDASWKRYSVRPADFDAPDQWSVGWASVRGRVNTFTVFGVSGSELWIDDIRMFGISGHELP